VSPVRQSPTKKPQDKQFDVEKIRKNIAKDGVLDDETISALFGTLSKFRNE